MTKSAKTQDLTFEVTIKGSDVEMMACDLAAFMYDEYSNEVTKEMGIDKEKVLVKKIAADESFRKAVAAYIKNELYYMVKDADQVGFDTPVMKKMIKEADKIQARVDKEDSVKFQDAAIKDAVDYLKSQGYKVTK